MPPSLQIKITMKDGAVFEFEKELDNAKVFLDAAEHCGFVNGGRFYPSDSILTIEAGAPDDYPTDPFSES